jgi:hypothetical protein
MRIQIVDVEDDQNWLNWGNLVLTWIRDPQTRPHNVGELNTQLDKNSVKAKVDGPDSKPVLFWDYPANNDPIQIALPTKAMLEERLQTVHPGAYPLPHFYDIAFAGAARAQLSGPVSLDFAARRIGEYSVNECC